MLMLSPTWKREKIGAICRIIGGGTPSRRVKRYFKGNIPWATVKDLREEKFVIDSTQEHITEEAIANSSTNLIEPGAIIVATRVGLGKMAINIIPLTINQDLKALKCHIGIDPIYVMLALHESLFHLLKFGQGSTVKGIHQEDLLNIEIPVPPLPVQRAITTILNQADAIRSKRSEASNLADQLSNAIFVEMLGHPATNPQKWPRIALDSFLTQVRRSIDTNANDDYKQVTVRWYGKGAKIRKHGLGSERKTKRQYLVKKGDFIYSRIDARKGAFAVAHEEVDGCIATSDFPMFEIDESYVLPKFLESFSKLPYFWKLCAQNSEGTTNRARLKEDKLLQIKIPLPPLEEQAYFVQANDHLLATLGKQSNGEDTSDDLMATLLNRAFTGELTAKWEATHADLIANEVARLQRRPRLALLALVAQQQRRGAVPIGITSLMKYTFLAQQEGQTLHHPVNHFYDFVPYHFGPFAKDIYADLEALEAEGWFTVRRASDDDLDAPERIEISLSSERINAVEEAIAELSTAEQADLEAVITQYGDLSHNELLDVVYEKYPTYAKKSRRRK